MGARTLVFVAAAALAVAPLACVNSSSPATSDGGAGTGGNAGTGGSAGQGGAPPTDGGGGSDGAVVNNCPAPTGAPIVHNSDITKDETWSADSVHVVASSRVVHKGVTLTIAPCAVVEIDPDTSLKIDGVLVAKGKPGEPIQFKRHGTSAWGNLYINYPGKATLAYASVEGGGSDITTYAGASVVAYGDGQPPPLDPILSVDHVSVTGSVGYGIVVNRNAGFASGSTALALSGNGKGDTAHPYPLFIQVRAAGTVPDGQYTGNQTDAIGVDASAGTDSIGDITLRDHGVPYDCNGTIDVTPQSAGASASLHIDPGVVLALVKDAGISVTGKSARLAIAGTAQKPVSIRRAGAAPWGKIYVESPATASLSYVTLKGGGNDVVSYPGASIVAYGTGKPPLQPLLKVDHVSVLGSRGIGVKVDRYGAFTSDSTALTVSGSGAGSTTYQRPVVIGVHDIETLPDGTYTGNAVDQIRVDTAAEGATLDTTVTIHDRGVPYVVSPSAGLHVDQGTAASAPTLTFEAGVHLLFDPAQNFAPNLKITVRKGALAINCTAQKPVLLGSAAKSPARGDWAGVEFDAAAAGFSQKIDHAIIEYAGGSASVSGYTCDPAPGGNALPENASVLILGWAPPSELVTHTQIKLSGGNGIVRGWDLTQGAATDFTPTNTFDPAPGGYVDQTQPRNPGGTPQCPAGTL